MVYDANFAQEIWQCSNHDLTLNARHPTPELYEGVNRHAISSAPQDFHAHRKYV
jgi:hypothetical protein